MIIKQRFVLEDIIDILSKKSSHEVLTRGSSTVEKFAIIPVSIGQGSMHVRSMYIKSKQQKGRSRPKNSN